MNIFNLFHPWLTRHGYAPKVLADQVHARLSDIRRRVGPVTRVVAMSTRLRGRVYRPQPENLPPKLEKYLAGLAVR